MGGGEGDFTWKIAATCSLQVKNLKWCSQERGFKSLFQIVHEHK